MAKITPGSIVSKVSGKLAGSVFTSSPNGMQIRPRAKLKRNVPTAFRYAKQILASGASRWRELTNAQRTAWIAATADYTHPDRLGNMITMTGLQLYVAILMANQFGGSPFSTSPPSPVSYPPFNNVELICEVDFFRFSGVWVPDLADHQLTLYASGPMSPGISSYSKSDLFWMDGFPSENPVELDFSAVWEQRFGPAALHVGKKVFAEIWGTSQVQSDILRFIAAANDIIFI